MWDPTTHRIIISRDVFDVSTLIKSNIVEVENIQELDVKTKFLHGDLDEEIYMEQIEGFVQDHNRNFFFRLRKSLYGPKEFPRQWYKKFHSFMVIQSFTRSEYDHCVYFKSFENGLFIILVLYVDDMLVASKRIVEINGLKLRWIGILI